MFDRQKKGERAVLVLPHARGSGDAERRAAEFAELVKSAGAEVLGSVTARVEAPNPRFYIGSGKADEVAEMVRALDADLVLVDHLLSPVQERNLEKHLSARVVDRAGLILDIFAQRARSHEGKLEVELAQLKHIATRLVRGWTHLDAQRGGAIGNRGPGETQLETDRRLLNERVKILGKRLEKVQTQRTQQRRARLRNTVPRVALVGYTNAGKSTLFNALTEAGTFAANQLFATLDTTLRRMEFAPGEPLVLADTVGFIRHLPHELVTAFRSTLEETLEADLLIHVVDAASPERDRQMTDVEAVLKEINGYTWADRRQVASFKDLKNDGSTACGAWIYTGVYPKEGENKARARTPDGPDGPGTHLGWGFAWPANRRTMYNRASADPQGRPWSERKKLVWWDAAKGEWQSPDAIDFEEKKPPSYEPDWSRKPQGMDALSGSDPFIMIADGRCSLFVPSGLKDAPLPAHYEPVESPVRNAMYAQQDNPVAKKWPSGFNAYHAPGDPRYPYVLTTYRLTEHHSGGTPTRSVASTAELQPEGFAEIPVELARELGIANRDWVVLSTARGEIETRALVTARVPPLEVQGQRVYQIGLPFHFGWQGFATGDVANVLTSVVGEPNTGIHEGKALTCALRKGRLHAPQEGP